MLILLHFMLQILLFSFLVIFILLTFLHIPLVFLFSLLPFLLGFLQCSDCTVVCSGSIRLRASWKQNSFCYAFLTPKSPSQWSNQNTRQTGCVINISCCMTFILERKRNKRQGILSTDRATCCISSCSTDVGVVMSYKDSHCIWKETIDFSVFV